MTATTTSTPPIIGATNPELQDLLARPMFQGLTLAQIIDLCKQELTKAEQWYQAMAIRRNSESAYQRARSYYLDLQDTLAALCAEQEVQTTQSTFARATTQEQPLEHQHMRRCFAACRQMGLPANSPATMREMMNRFFFDMYSGDWKPIRSRTELTPAQWNAFTDAVLGGTFGSNGPWRYVREQERRAA